MYNWDTLSRNHQGGTQIRRTQVPQGEELNTFNLFSRGILIWCRWGTCALLLQSAFNKVSRLIIYSKLVFALRWRSGSRVIISVKVSQ